MNQKNKILSVMLLFVATFSYAQHEIYTPPTQTLEWYSTGTFYEMFVRSFYDSDGDGHGDFNGVTAKVDYLKSLGICGIWLMPITDSSDRQHCYAVRDYFQTEQKYGTLEEFKTMLDACHKAGIKIIIDFVVNHCSSRHPYFLEAKADKNSQYRDWFVWADDKKGVKEWYETETGWYYGHFSKDMPDFNYENPKVVEYMQSIMRYWLDIGVDGFRYDAVTHLTDDVKRDIEFFRAFRSVIEEEKYKSRKAFLICEASTKPYNEYLGNGNDSFNAAFNFMSTSAFKRVVKNEKPIADNGINLIEDEIRKYCVGKYAVQSGAFYAQLLSNHDAGVTGRYRPFREFDGNIDKTILAGSLYLTLPGIPFVYYGEEIGLDSSAKFKGDLFLRAPIQWTAGTNAGFTTGTKTWNIIAENYQTYNVQTLDAQPNSILNKYRMLIKIRNENPALSVGTFQAIDNQNDNKQILGYIRQFEDNTIVVVHNFAGRPISNVKFDLKGTSAETALNGQNVLSSKNLTGKEKIKIKDKILTISKLDKYGSSIIKLQ